MKRTIVTSDERVLTSLGARIPRRLMDRLHRYCWDYDLTIEGVITRALEERLRKERRR